MAPFMKKAVFVCPLCGRPLLKMAEASPRCSSCKVKMEACGEQRDYTKICRRTTQDRIRLANSADSIPQRGR